MDHKTASQLLTAVYALDAGFGDLDAAISQISDEDERKRYATALGDIFGILFGRFVRPIEKQYPDLASQE